MTGKKQSSTPSQDLRRRAEELYLVTHGAVPDTLTPEEARHLLRELQVHQIELELQNAELRRKQQELDFLRESAHPPAGVTASLDRKPAELQIQESRDFLDKIFKASADGIVIAVKNSIITMANDAMEKILGYSKDELIGKSLIEMAPPGDAYYEKGIELVTRLFQEGSIERVEQVYMHKDGHLVDIELSAALIKDSGGNMTGSVGVFRDITARKLAENERLRLLAAIDQAEENILITDGEGNIQYINSVAWRKGGTTREALLGKNIFTLGSQNDTKDLLRDVGETISSGRTWRGRMQDRFQDGSFVEFDSVITPVKDASGAIINYISVSRDVTREVQLEQQLLQSQKMEAIGTLAGGIAHDFNNILAGMLGFIEIAKDEVPHDSQLSHYLDQTLKLGDRAINLVRQILAFSRKTDSNRTPMQLSPLIKEVLNLLRATLPATIEVRQKLLDQGSMIEADPTQIHQVLMNLCTNAGHAMQEKAGVLEIELTRVIVNREDVIHYKDIEPGPHVLLKVSDTGKGIDPAHISRIFDPFFTTKEVGKGTGLGLSVVHGIIKGHRGDIKVTSEPGRGTTFSILLPEAAAPVKHEKEADKAAPLSGCGHILYVDDEAALTEIAKMQLEPLGYRVTAAQSSREALELFQQDPERFALVITDLSMPHMTGYELAQELIRVKPGTPVILCTGYNETAVEKKVNELNIKAVLTKPVSRRALTETIRNVLNAQ